MGTVRDIAIIILAVEALVVGVFLIILVWEVRNLIKLLREEGKTILTTTDETVRTVRGTATFVSENLIVPVARFSGFVAGVSEGTRILLHRKKK